MDKLKALFGDKALTYAELEAALKDSKEIKLANLASGQYVDIGKFKQAETQANDLQAQLAQRNRDLAELKKLDAAGIQAQLDTLKGKYADDTRALTVAYPSIERFCADAGYRGTFTFDASQTLGRGVDISEKIKPHEWEKLPWRWIVERTLAWFNHSRRLSKDYEILTASAEAVSMISHAHTLLNRL